ncbi:MAG: kinase, partial [Dehalococcoidia bacterium]|nr:kinase [Dehalococcoidia bacterium]
RELPPFFDHRFQIVWSRIERVDDIAEIEHPLVKEVLRSAPAWVRAAAPDYGEFGTMGLSVVHDGDLPARSGMGASASFAVAFIASLYALYGRSPHSRKSLVLAAIEAERALQGGNVGIQDQIAAAYGSFNRIKIERSGDFQVLHLLPSGALTERLEQRLLLFYTGVQRNAADVAAAQVERMAGGESEGEVGALAAMVDEACLLLARGRLDDFGALLHEGWELKRRLGAGVSTPEVDRRYAAARTAGALGGKLLGAGGGGFLLVYAPEGRQEAVRAALADLVHVPFRFEHDGCRILHAETA